MGRIKFVLIIKFKAALLITKILGKAQEKILVAAKLIKELKLCLQNEVSFFKFIVFEILRSIDFRQGDITNEWLLEIM